MKVDFAYMEFISTAPGLRFANAQLSELLDAVSKSAVHTFGWPIAAVIPTAELAPKFIKDGVEALLKGESHRDFWSVNRDAQFYFVGELFENSRRPTHVFIDTRTNRITEIFMRVHGYYKAMGVQDEQAIGLLIKHGNIRGRILGAGSQARFFPTERRCSVNDVETQFDLPLKKMIDIETIKANVHLAVRDLGEMFDGFFPRKEDFTDPIVENYLRGRII